MLITGESGTGKELIAQAIHYNSLRKDKKFVAINCGALPESLLESELFGYKKGAFTGATSDRQGLLETADGGTLFLDEVGNLPMNVQKTLLRFLQEQEFHRIGDRATVKVDVRIISATNADLKTSVKDTSFREDLYYRLNVVNLHLPPLRERVSDIPLLAIHFINHQNSKFGTQVKGLAPDALDALAHYPWPGNIRQLKNVIEASMAMETGDYISLAVLSQFIEVQRTEEGGDAFIEEGDYNKALSRFEVEYLKGLLRKNHGQYRGCGQGCRHEHGNHLPQDKEVQHPQGRLAVASRNGYRRAVPTHLAAVLVHSPGIPSFHLPFPPAVNYFAHLPKKRMYRLSWRQPGIRAIPAEVPPAAPERRATV